MKSAISVAALLFLRRASGGSRLGAAVLCTFLPLAAVDTQTWEQSSMADYEKGTLTRVSLSSEGHLTLAPTLKEMYDPSVTFLWSVARDSKGTIYAGGGALGGTKAKLFVIDTQGRGKLLADLDGIAVQALAVDRQDRIYAATSPDGKVYRVDANGGSSVFYDPRAKYIWALAFAPNGDLYVATGDEGEIHKVTPAGAGSVFFKTDETHARSLAVDSAGSVFVGTEPNGLVLRVSPAGEGFVLYQTARREVTAVAVARDGTIYAAAVGNRQQPAPPPAPPAPTTTLPPASPAAAAAPRPAPLTLTLATPAITGGSEIYHILADGYPRRVWSHAQDLVYSLAFDTNGRVIAGTGNKGVLYRIDTDHSYTRLLDLSSEQITAMNAAADGRLVLVTGNIGKVYSVGPGLESSGVFESEVLDAGGFSYWGRLMPEPPESAGVVFESRSGNLSRTQRNWSPWARLNNGRIVSPAARFVQYRATLTGANAEVRQVYLAHQMKNVAPVVDQVDVTPPNYRFPAPAPAAAAAKPALTLPPLGRRPAPAAAAADAGATPAMQWAKGQIGVRWLASDENSDSLSFKVEIRGVNETTWKPVQDEIRERYCSWDSTAFPDGKYVARITASDAPSNPPDKVLSGSRETDPFLIDNTPPEISGLNAVRGTGGIDVQFHAKDALNWLGKAEYSVNGGPWLVVEPTTRLTDSMEHDYRVMLTGVAGETTIAVRVSDEYENQAVAKSVVK